MARASWWMLGASGWAVVVAVVAACAEPARPADAPELTVPRAAPTASSDSPDATAGIGTLDAVAHGEGVFRTHEPSPDDVARKNREQCEAGVAAGCHAAALDAYYSPSTPQTDRAAFTYFERACAAGYSPSCNGLGLLYREGRGAPRDDVEASRRFRQACEGDGSTGCQHLAQMLRAGRGVAKDPAAADRADARAKCLLEHRDPASCPSL